MSTGTKTKRFVNLFRWLQELLDLAKGWYAEDGTEKKLRNLRWLKALIQVKNNPHFVEWLKSLTLDYFQLSRKASPDYPATRTYLDGKAEAAATILSAIEDATQEQYDIDRQNLEDTQKKMAR